MRRVLFVLLSVVLFASFASAQSAKVERTASPEGAKVYIIAPADGDVVSSPVNVKFGLVGMGVAPAGIVIPKTGHHHLIVDSELPDFEKPLPADKNHIHFGGGQTETVLELTPGKHTLQLLLADALHLPHQPPVYSEKITVEVK